MIDDGTGTYDEDGFLRGLQAERTGMAWVRTLIVAAGCSGLVAFHSVHDHDWIALGIVCAAAGAAMLITAGWIGARRTASANTALTAGSGAARPSILLGMSGVAAAIGLSALIAALIP